MRRIILALCLLLAVGAIMAGTEEIVPKEKQKATDKTEAKADVKSDAKADAKSDAHPDGDPDACRETFNTLEDIYGADKEALAKHLAALKKAVEAGKNGDSKPATAVEWKEVPQDKPDR